mgnify:CR=1 FL=1
MAILSASLVETGSPMIAGLTDPFPSPRETSMPIAETRYYVLDSSQEAEWRAILPARRSVLGSVEYAKICEKQFGYSARLFVLCAPEPVLAYPFCLRSVSDLPFPHSHRAAWDTLTPGYTGPLPLGNATADRDAFVAHFQRYCGDHGIIAEFAHLNPWCGGEQWVDSNYIEKNREIVYVDLTATQDEVWTKSLHPESRRKYAQGQRAGVRARRAETSADIDAFHQIHTETMNRRNALSRYYYPPGFFQGVLQQMPDNAFVYVAEYDNRVVAGGLFFEDDRDVFWDMSAADLTYSSVRPVNVYLYDVIVSLLARGKQRLILGGGYQPNDGIFRFKASLSPLRAAFSTYRRIHDADAYQALTKGWSDHYAGAQPQDGYFPAYRCTPPAPAEEQSA